MTDPADLFPGQRVRLTIEGTVLSTDLPSGPRVHVAGVGVIPATSDATIEILSKPRPDEPKNPGAIVSAGRLGEKQLRDFDGRWLGHGDDGEWADRSWADLPDPVTVLHPGWDGGHG